MLRTSLLLSLSLLILTACVETTGPANNDSSYLAPSVSTQQISPNSQSGAIQAHKMMAPITSY